MRILPAFYALITLLPATLLAGEAPVIQYHAQTGKVRFIQGEADVSGGNTAARTGSTGKQPPLQRYAPLFGIDDVEKDLTLSRRGFTAKNRRVARYQQQYNGLPVIGGELVVNTDSGGRMLSMNGEISPEVSLDTTPTLNAEKAKKPCPSGRCQMVCTRSYIARCTNSQAGRLRPPINRQQQPASQPGVAD